MNAIASDPVGIIGAGRLGQAMARTALRAGRSVVIANSRGPEALTSVVSALGKGVSARCSRSTTRSPASTSSDSNASWGTRGRGQATQPKGDPL